MSLERITTHRPQGFADDPSRTAGGGRHDLASRANVRLRLAAQGVVAGWRRGARHD